VSTDAGGNEERDAQAHADVSRRAWRRLVDVARDVLLPLVRRTAYRAKTGEPSIGEGDLVEYLGESIPGENFYTGDRGRVAVVDSTARGGTVLYVDWERAGVWGGVAAQDVRRVVP
jgi:hypothetical protein